MKSFEKWKPSSVCVCCRMYRAYKLNLKVNKGLKKITAGTVVAKGSCKQAKPS